MADFHRFDPLIQTEDISFRQDELVKCECGRTNAPNRDACLYCGRWIADVAEGLKTDVSLESWENGFNVVATQPVKITAEGLERLARLGVENTEAFRNSLSAVPLARLSDDAVAQSKAVELRSHGLECKVVSDEAINLRELSIRLSGLELREREVRFVDFGKKSEIVVNREDIVLLVPGTIVKTRSQSIEKRKGKSATIIDESETDSREVVLDVFSRTDSRGFRVTLTGFDFSLLGGRKTFVAEENLSALGELLRSNCPNARVVEDYTSLRPILDEVWPIEAHIEALGMRSVRFGKSGMAKASTTSNLEQFTRFSRLQWHVQ